MCKTCKVNCYLGYGSGRMFIGDWKTNLKDYYEEVKRWRGMEPSTVGNKHIEEFLKLHEKHEIEYHGECCAVRDGKLVYEDPIDSDRDEVIADNYSDYKQINKESLLQLPLL